MHKTYVTPFSRQVVLVQLFLRYKEPDCGETGSFGRINLNALACFKVVHKLISIHAVNTDIL